MKFAQNKLVGKVESVYLSEHPEPEYEGIDYFVTGQVDQLKLDTAGIIGDRHYGHEASSGGRMTNLYPRGETVRNNRQILIVSPQELESCGRNLGIEGKLSAEDIGANMVVSGLENVSGISPMSYLVINNDPGPVKPSEFNVVLVAYAQAIPCEVAGRCVVDRHGLDEGMANKFQKASFGARGLAVYVEHGGVVKPGQYVHVLTPRGLD